MLIDKQDGLSPLTGDCLDGRRLETHHIIERHEGGTDRFTNLQVLPIAEHLYEHYCRFWFDGFRPEWQQVQEYETVRMRWGQLTSQEKKEFYGLLEERVGITVRFV